MRRRARVLSAAVLTGAVLGAAAPAAYGEPAAEEAAYAEPAVAEAANAEPAVDEPAAEEAAAEVNPHAVAPGDTITVSVSCDPTGGPAPEAIDASSQTFEQGTVQLQR